MTTKEETGRYEKLVILHTQQNGRCYYCNVELYLKDEVQNGVLPSHKVKASYDHIVPRSQNGTRTISNGVCACRLCNTIRDIMPVEEFVEQFDTIMADRKALDKKYCTKQ